MSNTQIIHLDKLDGSLLTGRKNGERAHDTLRVEQTQQYKIVARQEQLVTSSYFLGLLGNELVSMAEELGSVNEVLEKINIEQLNPKSKEECIRAIRRSIATPRSLMG
ncbi:hypothetical protein ACRTC7_11035 [Vibrio fluvialis]|uniref:hypothetical protein n=1 Tax=Vibrio fluvialis TaxID=676 RepID=UPI003D7C5F58